MAGTGGGGNVGGGGTGGNSGFGGTAGSGAFDTRVLDLRGFQRFRIDQTEALTPQGCPIPYLVDPAEIERISEGAYLLTFRAGFSSEQEFLLCLGEAADPDDCSYAPPVPGDPRTLNESELAELVGLFSTVSVNFAPNPCDGISVDQCNIVRVTWDDLETSDRFCESPEPWIQTEFALNVLQAVSELALLPSD